MEPPGVAAFSLKNIAIKKTNSELSIRLRYDKLILKKSPQGQINGKISCYIYSAKFYDELKSAKRF